MRFTFLAVVRYCEDEAVDENGGSRGRCPHCGGLVEFDPSESLTVGDLTLDVDSHEVVRGGRPIPLTPTEFDLMRFFMENPRRVLSPSQLFDGVWGYDFGPTSNRLQVCVGYLRRKLGEPRVIETVRGLGYILRPPPPSSA